MRKALRIAVAASLVTGLVSGLGLSITTEALAGLTSGSSSPIDTASLAAQREAQLVRRNTAISVHRAATEAIQAQRIAELGYDPAVQITPQDIAREMMRTTYGWGDDQFQCYDDIIMRESRWITTADNPTSSAYGIPQALPGSKMASAGADWRTNPATQIKWGLGYVKQRYATPCKAWSFKRSHGWY